MEEFQSTHPRGVRRLNPEYFSDGWLFQSTHPRGVRLSLGTLVTVGGTFQSTHPRGVRPTASRHVQRGTMVSIHAPTRGATSLNSNKICL